MSSSDLSPNLALPFLLPAQAQKHVTHNEALGLLDVLVQLTVQDFSATTPPANPVEGVVWALGDTPTDAWAGQGGKLATWLGGAWQFITPRPGWRAADQLDGLLRVWTGTDWVRPALDNLDGIGIGTAHDATNRLAVAADATLLSHGGSDHRLVVNKATPADTASLLYQTGFSGRAEMGLTGDDDFSVKVSADGTAWIQALQIAAGSGIVTTNAGFRVGPDSVYHRGNVLGSLGTVGGKPTGALFETGTNANGHYVRYADGTQMCWQTLPITTRAAGSTQFEDWIFPASFVSGVLPFVTSSPRSYNNDSGAEDAARHLRTAVRGVSNNSSRACIVNTHSAAIDGRIDIKAIGRWH